MASATDLQSGPILKRALEQAEQRDRENPLDCGEKCDKANDPATASGAERYTNPTPSYGHPRFEGSEDSNRPPSPEPQNELDEDERLLAALNRRIAALRQRLHLDEDDEETIAAWDELARSRGLECKLHMTLFHRLLSLQ